MFGSSWTKRKRAKQRQTSAVVTSVPSLRRVTSLLRFKSENRNCESIREDERPLAEVSESFNDTRVATYLFRCQSRLFYQKTSTKRINSKSTKAFGRFREIQFILLSRETTEKRTNFLTPNFA